jgi:hypothetical protein
MLGELGDAVDELFFVVAAALANTVHLDVLH